MTPRRDFGATDIARENAAVWIAVGSRLIRLLIPAALVFFTVATAIANHDRVATTPNSWLHHLGGTDVVASLWHLIALVAVIFVGMALESLVLCRNAFCRGERASVISTVLAAARRFLRGAGRVALLSLNVPSLRPSQILNHDPDRDILRQLRNALSIAPVGPPTRLVISSDPWGLFAQSGHRAEVCAAT